MTVTRDMSDMSAADAAHEDSRRVSAEAAQRKIRFIGNKTQSFCILKTSTFSFQSCPSSASANVVVWLGTNAHTANAHLVATGITQDLATFVEATTMRRWPFWMLFLLR